MRCAVSTSFRTHFVTHSARSVRPSNRAYEEEGIPSQMSFACIFAEITSSSFMSFLSCSYVDQHSKWCRKFRHPTAVNGIWDDMRPSNNGHRPPIPRPKRAQTEIQEIARGILLMLVSEMPIVAQQEITTVS